MPRTTSDEVIATPSRAPRARARHAARGPSGTRAARRLAAALGAAALAACSRSAPGTPARADTPRVAVRDTLSVAMLGAVSGPPTVQSTVRTTPTSRIDYSAVVAAARAAMPPDTAPPTPLSPEARRACDSLAAVWESVPGAVVRRGDTLVRPGDVIGDSTLAQWGDRPTGPAVTACFVKGELEEGADSATHARLSWMKPGLSGRKDAWAPLQSMWADGPGGSDVHYQRGLTRCRVTQQSDPGDDSDSPYYHERIVCWTHWRELVPQDTARWGG